jgi:hypothetical protein
MYPSLFCLALSRLCRAYQKNPQRHFTLITEEGAAYSASTTAIATAPVEIENLRSIFSTFSVQEVYIVVCVRVFGLQESMSLCWKTRAGQINDHAM